MFNAQVYRSVFYIKQSKKYKVLDHGGVTIRFMRKSDRKIVGNVPRPIFLAAKLLIKNAKITIGG